MNKFQKDFIDFINRHLNKSISPYYLSRNPLVSIESVLENPHLNWSWQGLSENANMTWEIVQKYKEKPWSWVGLSRNPNIGWDILHERYKYVFGIYNSNMGHISVNPPTYDYFDIDWHHVSQSSKTTLEMWRENPEGTLEIDVPNFKSYYNWFNSGISLNPNLTEYHIREYYNEHSKQYGVDSLNMCWWNLSRNESVDWDIIRKYDYCGWIFSSVSSNPNITLDIVKNNLDLNWYWGHLCKNSSITWEDIKENPDLFKAYYSISINPNITPEIVKENPDYPWNWAGMSFNPSLSIEFVEENLDKNWNWQALSGNPFNSSRKNYVVQWVEKTYTNKKKRLAKKVASMCQEWWYNPDNKISMKMCEKMWKLRIPITEIYGNTI